MATMSLIHQVQGPLPHSVTFSAPSDGPACFVLSGSVWARVADQMIGITLELDGVAIGTAQIFSNGTATHRAVVPSYIPVTLTYGKHTISVLPLNAATVNDVNDWFNVVLLY
jgi:hypothetical protein